MLSIASMATSAPTLRPLTSEPWQTKRAPPSSCTMAMCSGDLEPGGGGWGGGEERVSGRRGRGHGGASAILHRGHCEALMVSIICSGCRLHGYSRGWAALGAAWLRSTSG